jgi:hypothetical protein
MIANVILVVLLLIDVFAIYKLIKIYKELVKIISDDIL